MKRISRVYLNGVLDHTPDTEGAIREVHRVLRPGGVAKVMLYHRRSLNYWVEIVLRRGVLGAEFLLGRDRLRRRIGWNVIITATK